MATKSNTRIESTSNNGKLPEGWRMVQFGDVVRDVKESERNPLEAGLERYIGLEHIEPENLHIKKWGDLNQDEVSFTKRFRKGQVLFGKRRAYQRKVAVAEFDGICSGDILTFEPKDDELVPELLPFIVQSEAFFNHALGTSSGSLSPRTRWSQLKDFGFPLPQISEQRRIANTLWAADESVRSQLRLVETIEKLKVGVINEFMPPDVPFRDLRCQTIPGHKCFRLRDLAMKVTDGVHLTPKFSDSGFPFLLVSNLASGTVDWNVQRWISKDVYKELTRTTKAERGDVLYTVVASFGVPVYVDWDRPFSFQRHIALIKPDPQKLSGKFLTYYLQSPLARKQAEIYAEGNAQRTITLKSLNEFAIPLPDLDSQQEIVERIEKIEHALHVAQQHLDSSRELAKRLTNRLTGGQHVQ